MNECVDGVLLLNKPTGMTSNAVLQTVKRLFKAQKAGHTGTLDPMATGMLPICFGEATKFSQFLLNQHKTYEATGILGAMTTTGDAEGEVISTSENKSCTREALLTVLSQFKGTIEQIPPMYSALKHKGKPLYQYARAGKVVPRVSRKVDVLDMQLQTFNGQQFKFRTQVSKGTYIRTLIEDIGLALGSQAYMTQLHRLSTAGFEQKQMIDLDTLTKMTDEARKGTLLPVDCTVADLPVIHLSAMDKTILYQGQLLSTKKLLEPAMIVALRDENGTFFGVGCCESDSTLKAKRLRKAI